MAFLRLAFTANTLNKLQEELKLEKEEAYKQSQGKKPKKKFKLNVIIETIEGKLKSCCRIFSLPETSCLHRTCYKLQRDGSCENFTLKSVFGFFGGILLTYVLFIFFVFQLNLRLTTATIFCSFLGCILTLGLAFSTKIRCIVLLTLPQFFSKKGRQALLAYGFILALTGPAQNTVNNLGILSESLACGQEQLKQAVRQIIEVIKKPFLAIKEAIKKVVKTVKDVVKMIKEIFLKIKRIIMAIVKIIKTAFEFLGKIINICNKELGTPFERCTRVFENAILDCNAKLGPLFSWICSITYIVKAVCYIVKIFDYVCMLVDFFTDSVIGVVIRKVKSFIRHVKTMFYVRIKFAHSYKFQTTASKTMKEIAKEIVKEIKERSKGIVAFFTFMTSAAMLFFIFIIFQVTYYRIKYLTSERFDNIYITKHFRQIDMRRAKLEKETVLPLNKREENIYVAISSAKLAKIERKSLSKSMTTLGTAALKLGTHMLFDYCLYWVLNLISYHAKFQTKQQLPNLPSAHVTGEGLLAKLLRAIVKAFQPVGIELEIDTVPCLPIPIPPNYDRYVQIAIVIVICFILTALEPYGLRFRNYIMGYYHPVRAKQRTIWLYNHILRSRVSFLDLARRALKRKFGHKGFDKITCKEWLQANLRCGIFRICLGSDLQMACMVCGEIFREGDSRKPILCATPGCPGVFCEECFKDLNNICPICLNPLEYGEVEDEEKDSSGDERPPKPPKKSKCNWFPCCRKSGDDEKELVTSEEKPAQDEPPQKAMQDDGEQKIKDEEPLEDKGAATDSSTDYSYTYQDEEEQKQSTPKPYPLYKDVEKQAIPDYESMQSFREMEEENIKEYEPMVIELDIDNKIRPGKARSARVEFSVSSEVTDDELETETEVEKASLLNRQGSEESRHVEFIGVFPAEGSRDKNIRKHKRNVGRKLADERSDLSSSCSDIDFFEETSFITLPKSTMSTSTKGDCQCCHLPIIETGSSFSLSTTTKEELRNVVPPLDLSFIDNAEYSVPTDSTRTLSKRFQERVKYHEICETSSTTSTLRGSMNSSSSVLTDLQYSPKCNPKLRKRNVKLQCRRRSVEQSPSPTQCYEFQKRQGKKVSRYYKETKDYSDARGQKPKKKNIRDMFRKILPKQYLKENEPELPLYNRSGEDEYEIRSYNYCQRDWETLNVPHYCFHDPRSSEASESEQLLPKKGNNSRLRGGKCVQCTSNSQRNLEGGCCRTLSFEPQNTPSLKDYTKLLPSKPLTTKDLLTRYFTSIEDLTPTRDPGTQMRRPDSPKSVGFSTPGKESVLDLTNRTATSSESCLSEGTCFALFGGPCPAGLREKLNKRNSAQISPTPEVTISTPDLEKEEVTKTVGNLDQTGDRKSEDRVYFDIQSNLEVTERKNSQTSLQKRGSDSNQSQNFKERIGERETDLSEERNNSLKQDSAAISTLNNNINSQLNRTNDLITSSTQGNNISSGSGQLDTSKGLINPSPQGSNILVGSGQLNRSKELITSSIEKQKLVTENKSPQGSGKLRGSKESLRSLQLSTGKQKSPTQLAFEKLEQIKEQPEEPPHQKTSGSQLNQLLYKDDKTEICLVQNLNSGGRRQSTSCPIQNIGGQLPSSTVRSISSPVIKTGQTPLVKLQVNLQNSLLPKEPTKPSASEVDIMECPKSKDQIVETKEVFPLCRDWMRETTSSSRIILASDKQQQTSDNDFYHGSNNTVSFSSQGDSSSTYCCRKCKCSSSSQQQSSTSDQRNGTKRDYYYTPERDTDQSSRDYCYQVYQKEIPTNRQVVHQETTTDSSSANVTQQHCNCCSCRKQSESYNNPPDDRKMRTKTPPRGYRTEYRTINFPSTSSDYSIPNPSMEYPEFLPPPPPRPPYTRNHSPRFDRTPRMERMPKMEVPSRMEPPPSPPPPPPPYRKHRGKCYEGCRCCYNNKPSRQAPPPPSPPYRHVNDYPTYSDDEEDFDESLSYTSLTDLPYQDKDEYMNLVQELQDTLHTRNRQGIRCLSCTRIFHMDCAEKVNDKSYSLFICPACVKK